MYKRDRGGGLRSDELQVTNQHEIPGRDVWRRTYDGGDIGGDPPSDLSSPHDAGPGPGQAAEPHEGRDLLARPHDVIEQPGEVPCAATAVAQRLVNGWVCAIGQRVGLRDWSMSGSARLGAIPPIDDARDNCCWPTGAVSLEPMVMTFFPLASVWRVLF